MTVQQRDKFGVERVLQAATLQGHTVLDQALVKNLVARTGERWAKEHVDILREEGSLVRFTVDGKPYLSKSAAVRRAGRIALWARMRQAEARVTVPPGLPVGAGLEPAQARAVALLRDGPAPGTLLLTGGPGTGKTYLIAHIVKWLVSRSIMTICVAPTGRAANNIAQRLDIDVPCMTVHRALRWRPNGAVEYDADRQLDYDAYIIDEASMIDDEMFDKLLAAIPPSAIVIIVGDDYQLEPVGPGSTFKDLIMHSGLPVARLDVNRRSEGSELISFFNLLRDGKVGPYGDRVRFMQMSQVDARQRAIQFMEAAHQRGSIEDSVILSPVRDTKFLASISKINQDISRLIWGDGITDRRTGFHHGERVMFTQNNYDLGYFNGDVGTAVLDDHSFSVRLDGGRTVSIYDVDRDHMEMSYATTIHKSQGGEYERVVLLMDPECRRLYSASSIYTAATRARSQLFIVGDTNLFRASISVRRYRASVLALIMRAGLQVEVEEPKSETERKLDAISEAWDMLQTIPF